MEENEITAYNDMIGLTLASQNPYQAPEFKQQANKEWVPYLDTDRTQFPDKLIYYKNNSAIHGAIIRNMSDQVAGNGFVIDGSLAVDKTNLFLNNISSNGEDANELLNKIAEDLVIFKGIALLVKWSKDGSTIINVDHLDFSKVRSGKVNEQGKITEYFYSYDWNTQRPRYVIIPAFNISSMADKKKAYNEAITKATKKGEIIPELRQIFSEPTEQILYFHPYGSNEFYYPIPSYVGAINAINSDIITDQYGLGMMSNGLSANHLVTFKGNYNDAQKSATGKSFVKSYVNGVKTGRPVLAFAKDADSAIEITPIGTNGKDQKYSQINENSTQKILSGHGVTSPMLVGIKEAGSLGGGDEIEYLSKLFYRNTIRPKQNSITKLINKIMDINKLDNVSIERLDMLTSNNEIENKKE